MTNKSETGYDYCQGCGTWKRDCCLVEFIPGKAVVFWGGLIAVRCAGCRQESAGTFKYPSAQETQKPGG